MLKDITLGQYLPGKSLIHRLDPRTKILLTIVYIAHDLLRVQPGVVRYPAGVPDLCAPHDVRADSRRSS